MRRLVLTAIAALLLVPACSSSATPGSGAGATPAAVVTLSGFAFHPATVTVRPGATVAWQFVDGTVVHNVIGDDGMHSPDMATGTFTHRFNRTGTYNYQCSIHAGMNGTVVVR